MNNVYSQQRIDEVSKDLNKKLRQAYNRKGWLSVKYKKLYCQSLQLKSQISRFKNIIRSLKKKNA